MVKLEENKYDEKKIVVFCVDGTAGLAPYWKQMKRNYIRPAIEALQDLKNIESGQYSSTCFATVVYGAGDGFGGPYNCIKEFEDTLQPKIVLQDLEELELHGGGFERRTHLVEAFSVALTILGTSNAAEKHIVIITNSDFYETKVHNINNDYYKKSLEQLVQASVAFQAKVSVIAPRVINSLKNLFNSSNFEGSPSQGNKIDGHHMILTHFVMENQPDPPQSIESQRQAAATPQKEEVKAEVKTEPSSEALPQIQTVQNSTQMMQTTQDPPKSMSFNQGQIHKPVMSQAGGIPPNPAQIAGQVHQVQPQQIQGQQQNVQPQISTSQTGHPGQQVNHQQNQPQQQHQMNPNQQQPQQQQTQQQKKVWTGELKWVDPGSESNQERRIGCSLSAQSQPEVGEEFLRGAPPLLKVNFIEQPMIQAVKGFFQNSTVLVFNWNENPVPAVNRETLGNLHSIMTQKNQVGVINVSQGQGQPKMLVMVFNQKNRSFLALIPNDPEGFFTKLKEVYQIQKRPGQEGVKQQNNPQQQQQQQNNPQAAQQQQNPQQQMNAHQMNQANMQRPMVSMPMNSQMQGMMPMRGAVPNSMVAARQINPGQPVMGMQNYMQRPQGQQPIDQQHHQQQQNPQQMQQFQMQQMQQQNQRQNFNPTQNNEQLRHLLIQNNNRNNPQMNQNQGYGNQGF